MFLINIAAPPFWKGIVFLFSLTYSTKASSPSLLLDHNLYRHLLMASILVVFTHQTHAHTHTHTQEAQSTSPSVNFIFLQLESNQGIRSAPGVVCSSTVNWVKRWVISKLTTRKVKPQNRRLCYSVGQERIWRTLGSLIIQNPECTQITCLP